jgi:hypothetical protein
MYNPIIKKYILVTKLHYPLKLAHTTRITYTKLNTIIYIENITTTIIIITKDKPLMASFGVLKPNPTFLSHVGTRRGC